MRFAQEISIFNPYAIADALVGVDTKITQTANEIRLEAAATYATQTGLQTLSSRVSQTATAISFSLSKNGDRTAVLSMTYTKEDGSTINLAAQSIEFTGLVRFNDLSTSGSTIINGANIQTGTLSASKITTGTMSGDRINAGTITGTTISGGTVSGGKIEQTVSGVNVGGFNPTVSTQASIENGIVSAGQVNINGVQFAPEGTDDSGYTGVLCRGHFSTYGTVWAGQSATDIYLINCRGKVWARGYDSVSDRRLKKDIEPLPEESAERFIYGITPVSYRYKETPTALHHGFIAQDVEGNEYDEWGVVDEHKNPDGNTYKTLSYTELIADLVATVQAQDKRIKALEGGQNG